MDKEMGKELSRLQLLWARYNNKIRMCPLEIKKEEQRAFIINEYIRNLIRDKQQLRNALKEIKEYCENTSMTVVEFNELLKIIEKASEEKWI